MKQDKALAESAYRKGLASKICTVVQRYPNDPSVICDVFAVLGSFRVEDLAKTPELEKLLSELVHTFAGASDNMRPKIASLDAVADFIGSSLKQKKSMGAHGIVEKLVVNHKIIEGLGKLLELHRPRKAVQDEAIVKKAEALLAVLSGEGGRTSGGL